MAFQRIEVCYLLITCQLIFFVDTVVFELPFHCRISSDGRWIVYNASGINQTKHFHVNSYNYTFELCRKHFEHCLEDRFRTDFEYQCTHAKHEISCPYPVHIFSEVRVRLRARNISFSLLENFTSGIAGSPFHNCSCEWSTLQPIVLTYHKQTLHFKHNPNIKRGVMMQMRDVATCDGEELQCSSFGNNIYQYNCRVTCQSLRICVKSHMKYCQNGVQLCRNVSQTIGVLPRAAIKCIVTDYLILTWKVPRTVQTCARNELKYILFDTSDQELERGKTDKKVLMKPVPKKSAISKVSMRLCCNEVCTKATNISCYQKASKSNKKRKYDVFLIVWGTIAVLLIVILGVSILKLRYERLLKANDDKAIHPAVDGQISLEEIENTKEEVLAPNSNEYEEISTYQLDEIKTDSENNDSDEEYFTHLNTTGQ